MIITFLQFLLVTCLAYPSQFQPGGTYTLRATKVPRGRWAFIAFMFFGINMLNNCTFAYHIAVPVHIILRSFGSVTTMIAGYLRGKRYSVVQVVSVVLLTVGVFVAAWADSASKGKTMTYEASGSSSEYAQGLALLLLAQLLSAYMGAYTEDTYAKFGACWTENLFYSHFLSLPLFLPVAGTLLGQYRNLAATPLVDVHRYGFRGSIQGNGTESTAVENMLRPAVASIARLPQGVFFLLTNAVTQMLCISGVNLLSAKSSAVTVTTVLSIRKLVSFILSTLIFGHSLDTTMIVGSTLVFGSGALYGWETSWRLPRVKAAGKAPNNHDQKLK